MEKNNERKLNIEQTEERLQKLIARFGVCSRRAAEELIQQGRVSVNGKTVTTLGVKVRAGKDIIAVDGRLLAQKPEPIYLLLNKPSGYICSASDERGRRTVLDLLPEDMQRVFPVGRLDYATTGVLLLTNDGELSNLLLHPKHEIEKTYLAFAEGRITPNALQRLQKGVRLEDGMTAPAKVKLRSFKEGVSTLEITIHEGRNRQVRRMCEAVGNPCRRLRRLDFAGLTADGLAPGAYRKLTEAEIKQLRTLVGLK